MHNGEPQTSLSLDRLGRNWGWKLERAENLPRVQEAITKDQPVAVYQDAGRRDWWSAHGPWPQQFERLIEWPAENRWSALLVISDRVLSLPPTGLHAATLVYRPPTLTLGVACRRGVGLEELEECVMALFERNRLSPACLTAVATVANRKHEPALLAFTEDRKLPLLAYGVDKLRLAHAAAGPKAPLTVAQRCEAAALLAAGVKELAVPKTVFPRLALAVARRTRA